MPELFEKLQKKLRAIDDVQDGYLASDFDLNPDANIALKPPKPAAVLVPIVERDGQYNVIFTRRSFYLRAHAGQISFPGGRIDEVDENIVQTAIREAYEEIGLEEKFISPIGMGDNYLSGTNYLITPIIAKIDPNAKFIANKGEVDEIFEIPFNNVFNKDNFEIREYHLQKIPRKFYAFNYKKYLIWGVTAGLIVNLTKRMAVNDD